jgi:peptidoglycan/xylan/chitin deacetylase (PgdA/CDA1 family)
VIVTTSWDDGHPLDGRLAEMLARVGLPATFYVPIENAERPVLPAAEIRQLRAAGFEIGGHTYHHTRLLNVSPEAARREVVEGKAALEDILGAEVRSFSYVGGQHSPAIVAMVREAGFLGARTTERNRLWTPVPGSDPYLMPTTLLARPFTRREEALKWLGAPDLLDLPELLTGRTSNVLRNAAYWLEQAARRGGVWHLWGHSWEVDRLGLWGELESVFRLAAQTRGTARWLTNEQLRAETKLLASTPEHETPNRPQCPR